ncbi:MAG: peptidylprolyl isomerase [Bacteroidota bacterium]
MPHRIGPSLFIVAATAALLTGCSPRAGDMVVARVGETPITLAEYEALYLKSSGSREEAAASGMEEREEFLGLMTNFRLKLSDAYRRGLHTDAGVLREISQYKGSLAASYLTDREVTSPGTRLLYQRRSEELRAGHILLTLAQDASAEDSAAAYARADSILGLLRRGEDFEALARALSQDPSARQNGGDLYYFTGGQMVPAFEDAVYAMKPGEISPRPIRTPYGLHIIRVTDRKPAPGEVRCSHIMIRFERQDPTPEDTAAALAGIRLIQDSIAAGVDFAELALRNSGDPGSASRGGDLDWFTRRRWIQPFDEAALALRPGQVSGIVRTIYGYHIIKCTDARPLKSFDEARTELQQLYQQVRFQEDYGRYMTRLRKETGYAMSGEAASAFVAALDSGTSTRDTAWAGAVGGELRAREMFRLGTRSVSTDSVIAVMRARPDMSNTPLRAASVWSALEKVGDQLIFEVKAETIERDYPEFAGIMKEYREGILLYQVEQEQVWSRIAVSDSALRSFHASHSEDFRWPDRADFSALRLASDSVAASVHARLVSGSSLEEIARADSIRMRAPASFQISFASGSHSLAARTRLTLQSVAALLASDPSLRLSVIAYHDTGGAARPGGQKLAARRLDALRTYLVKKLHAPSARITVLSRVPASTVTDSLRDVLASRADLELTGRRPAVLGNLDHALLPVDTDERTKQAARLAPGGVSSPFLHQGIHHILRLNRLEPARVKTFEEAGSEVSSAYQEHESRRLEREWLDGLRVVFPVMENKEALRSAFLPEK